MDQKMSFSNFKRKILWWWLGQIGSYKKTQPLDSFESDLSQTLSAAFSFSLLFFSIQSALIMVKIVCDDYANPILFIFFPFIIENKNRSSFITKKKIKSDQRDGHFFVHY